MKAIKRVILFALTAGVLLGSCAKNPKEDQNLIEQASLDAWMAKYQPDAVREGDMYYYLTPNPDQSAVKVAEGDWVKLNIVGTTLDGDIFLNTSDSVLAKQLYTFTRKTHYVPRKGRISYNATDFTKGQLDMLLQMKQGDSCRVYLPSKLIYGSTGISTTNGFEGTGVLSGNKPGVFDMKVVEVIKHETEYETNQVKAIAAEWGLDLVSDTIASDLVYYQYVDQLAANTDNNAGEEVSVENLAFNYYYSTRFLDNFVLSTNVDSVAIQAWGTTGGTLLPRLFDYSVDGTIEVLKAVADKAVNGLLPVVLRYGQTFRLVFTSNYGYGATGFPSSTDNPTVPYSVVYPYTPLIMEVYINPVWNQEEEED